MTSEQLKKVFDEFYDVEQAIMNWKSGEYATKDDKLANFKEVANLLKISPAMVSLSYLLKHMQSIALAVRENKVEWVWEKEGGEGLKQRFADARNYLLLLAACLEDEELRRKNSA